MASNESGGSSKRFSSRISEQGTAAIVTCSGRICFREEARKFSGITIGLLKSGKNIVLEFSDLQQIDSAGIGELVLVHMHARAAECTVRIVAPRPQVCDLLQLTNVASLFEICPTVEAALLSLTADVA